MTRQCAATCTSGARSCFRFTGLQPICSTGRRVGAPLGGVSRRQAPGGSKGVVSRARAPSRDPDCRGAGERHRHRRLRGVAGRRAGRRPRAGLAAYVDRHRGLADPGEPGPACHHRPRRPAIAKVLGGLLVILVAGTIAGYSFSAPVVQRPRRVPVRRRRAGAASQAPGRAAGRARRDVRRARRCRRRGHAPRTRARPERRPAVAERRHGDVDPSRDRPGSGRHRPRDALVVHAGRRAAAARRAVHDRPARAADLAGPLAGDAARRAVARADA